MCDLLVEDNGSPLLSPLLLTEGQKYLWANMYQTLGSLGNFMALRKMMIIQLN